MSAFDIFYLGLVLTAFAGFASILAYYSQRDRLPRQHSSKASAKSAAAHEGVVGEVETLHKAA
jgi:hypothetical protein